MQILFLAIKAELLHRLTPTFPFLHFYISTLKWTVFVSEGGNHAYLLSALRLHRRSMCYLPIQEDATYIWSIASLSEPLSHWHFLILCAINYMQLWRCTNVSANSFKLRPSFFYSKKKIFFKRQYLNSHM